MDLYKRYIQTAATRDKYNEILNWWVDNIKLSEMDFRRWLFLSGSGTPLFWTDSKSRTDLDDNIAEDLLEQVNELVKKAALYIEAATEDDYPEVNYPLTADNSGNELVRNSHKTPLGSVFGIYYQATSLLIEDAELLAMSLQWVIPYQQPSRAVPGPSGSPLSDTYYELLREKFNVNTHLLASPMDRRYNKYATQWNIGTEGVGSIGTLRSLLEKPNLLGSKQAYELNLLSLGPYYHSLLKEIIAKLCINQNNTIFVVHEYNEKDLLVTPSLIKGSITVGNVSFKVYSNNINNLTSQDLQHISLALGAPSSRRKQTLPFISDYERAYIVGVRAEQLARGKGGLPRVPVAADIVDPFIIAALEFNNKKIPLTIKRDMPNGSYETIDPNRSDVESHASRLNIMI